MDFIEKTLKIIDEIEALYPESVFPEPPKGKSPDCYSASGCRLACRNIRNELQEAIKLKE